LIKSKKLLKFKSITHGFFNKHGGRSSGIYSSLNCGIGSGDNRKTVLKNLNIICKKIKCSKKNLILLNQIHSNKIHFIKKTFPFKKKKGDGLITNKKRIAIGILTADCAPILIFDPKLKIVSAIHAGWKGAYKGIVVKAINALKNKGSKIENLQIVIGPCISVNNYEVKEDFKKKFEKQSLKNKVFFKTKRNKIYFNLAKYISSQIKKLGVKNLELIDKDTFESKNNFFSYRRSIYKKEYDYGRNLSLIMIN